MRLSPNPNYCYASLMPRGCSRRDLCRKQHDIGQCECGLVLHLVNFEAHKSGRRHRSMLNEMMNSGQQTNLVDTRILNIQPDGQASRCSHCGRNVLASEIGLHAQKHAREERLREVQAAFDQAELNKDGIIVSHTEGINFGVVEDENVDRRVDITIRGAEPTKNPDVLLLSYRMRSSSRKDAHGERFSIIYIGRSKWIKGHIDRTLTVVFHPSYGGQYEDTLELLFVNSQSKQRFIITRRVEATVGSRDDHERLRATAPYVPRQPHPVQFNVPLDTSIRPPVWTSTKWVTYLPEYTPPTNLITAAYGPAAHPHKKALANVKSFLPRVLNENTYGRHFQILLHVEEEKMRQDLDAYSLTGVEVTPKYPRYNLQVKGLAEGRPSVLVGDFILFSHAVDHDDFYDPKRIWHQGCVHQVHQNHVSLRFGGDFSVLKGTKFDVRFVLNRLPIRRMHRALSIQFNPSRLLFPKFENVISPRVTHKEIREINLFYRPLGGDDEQLETVAAIISQRAGSVPFVVFGPPGTGKTVTIVEAMRQLLDRSPSSRILACAPSNSAADLIAQKLIGLGSSQLFRLNSLSRKFEDLPKALRSVSQVNENKVFAIPPREDLEKFRVVVSTCISGGIPEGLGLKRGHFTHIFIDEAGQAKEPEVMVPIKSIAGPSTNVILAGDNQQLGPVVHSRLARDLGLKTSYLDRLMSLDIYDLKKFSGITIVKLVKNFRSHPDILSFSNDEFYNSELQACGDPMLTRIFENADDLPKKKFPMIFHGIVGRDQQEASSPSFFNIDEATLVKKYCKSLVEDRKLKTLPEHIGVITPYHAQRCKLLDLFHRDVKLRGIKVGSVEEFQGQERRIIILSTVRSSTNYVAADIKRSLGFVANPRRFNVAVTRAQALLIVIGNPIILSLDPLWRKFLNFIHTRGGWRGREINWNPEIPINPGQEGYDGEVRDRAEREMEETLERLKALIIGVDDGSGLEIDLTDGSDSDSDHDETPIFRDAE